MDVLGVREVCEKDENTAKRAPIAEEPPKICILRREQMRQHGRERLPCVRSEHCLTCPGANGTAVITGNKVDPKALPWVVKPQVLINVFSARHSDPNNLLDCGIFEDDVAKAQAHPIQIACKVIGES